MPLFNIDKERITAVPHHSEYSVWRRRLVQSNDLDPIKNELNLKVDGGDIHTSSWMPGNDWRKTPFQPIYDVACGNVEEFSGYCFGLILWEVMMERDEDWCFIKSENILGTTYFRPTW